jgi:hypothetical protein
MNNKCGINIVPAIAGIGWPTFLNTAKKECYHGKNNLPQMWARM